MSIKQSVFEEIVIESNDRSRRVDIASGSVIIDYYEDIFSPTITDKIRVVNTGNTIAAPNTKDGQKQSIYKPLHSTKVYLQFGKIYYYYKLKHP